MGAIKIRYQQEIFKMIYKILGGENQKTLLKDIKDLNKYELYTMLIDSNIHIAILPICVYKFN